MNYDVIVLRKSDIKLDGIEQLHGMNETFKRVFRCFLIHRLRYHQLVVVLEFRCHRIGSNTEQVVSWGHKPLNPQSMAAKHESLDSHDGHDFVPDSGYLLPILSA